MVAFYVVAVIENSSIAFFKTFQDYTNLHCKTLHVSVRNTDNNLLVFASGDGHITTIFVYPIAYDYSIIFCMYPPT